MFKSLFLATVPRERSTRRLRTTMERILNETKSQADKFREAARESGADESEDHFKARLRKIAKAKVSDDPPPEPPKDDPAKPE
ncbi:hypothetical protein [Acuticoccus sp. I52.16.1]|uniref:hypothetical protein n=1 Tax=Acuticoccus sp. I52.16.1 TaxID=2928472 RepID=UPI001FD09660|nr:hypothetical protein [Acuticoccus sp. I52.16.1]UOM36376.1 hypothetical protein MRB58_09375 [Acuticoccus sp. I52.16.1]